MCDMDMELKTRVNSWYISAAAMWTMVAVLRDEGDRIIVCLDANENIYSKRIGQVTEVEL